MDLIPDIIANDLNLTIENVKNFFVGPAYNRTVGDCERFLDRETGVLNEFKINFDGKITQNIHDRKYGKFTVRIYFPIDGVCIVGSIDTMCNFAIVRNAFNGEILKMTYYNSEQKKVVEGSYIIISSLTCESCIGLKNKTLKDGILESVFVFGNARY